MEIDRSLADVETLILATKNSNKMDSSSTGSLSPEQQPVFQIEGHTSGNNAVLSIQTQVELSVSKRHIRARPTCKKCKNHKILSYYCDGHKKRCAYRNCTCHSCMFTREEQKVMAELTALTREQRQGKKTMVPAMGSEDEESIFTPQNEKNKRLPYCRRCSNHNRQVIRRGHNCLFANCSCSKCSLMKKRKVLREKHQTLLKLKKEGHLHAMQANYHSGNGQMSAMGSPPYESGFVSPVSDVEASPESLSSPELVCHPVPTVRGSQMIYERRMQRPYAYPQEPPRIYQGVQHMPPPPPPIASPYPVNLYGHSPPMSQPSYPHYADTNVMYQSPMCSLPSQYGAPPPYGNPSTNYTFSGHGMGELMPVPPISRPWSSTSRHLAPVSVLHPPQQPPPPAFNSPQEYQQEDDISPPDSWEDSTEKPASHDEVVLDCE